MNKEKIKKVYDGKFLKLYDIEHKAGGHYYCASRRDEDRLPALMTTEECKNMLPDAVSCFVILRIRGQEPQLLLNWEYRYPAGQYLLSVPAGLIDPEDREKPYALELTAARELQEETGIFIQETDEIEVINPGVFSTPGLTDETNALVSISVNRERMPELSQDGAEETEQFGGFCLVSKEKAREYLRTGRDEHGMYYPLYTWAALMFFLAQE